MFLEVIEGKNEDILENYLKENNLTYEDILYHKEEENGGLFKGKKLKITILKKSNILEYIQTYFETIGRLMDLNIDVLIEEEDNIYKIVINAEDNSILIGKDGKTLRALQNLLKQSIMSKSNFNIKVNLDVGNYKERKLKALESLTKRLANEVIKTKVDVKMDSMNSFERRFVHNIIGEYTMLTTKSEGEEPNRYVVIKYNDK